MKKENIPHTITNRKDVQKAPIHGAMRHHQWTRLINSSKSHPLLRLAKILVSKVLRMRQN